MRLRRLPLLAAVLAATGLTTAFAAEDGDTSGLRGSLDNSGLASTVSDQEIDNIGRIIRAGPVDTTDPTADQSPAPARRAAKEEDPYAPLGMRAGGLIFLPALTLSGGYTTNAAAGAGGRPSGFLGIAPELVIRSDWERNEATLSMRGSYLDFTDGTTAAQPTADVEATSRLDLADRWNVALAGGYHFAHQSISDPNFPAGVDSPPGVHDFNGSAALNGSFGKNVFTLTGLAGRTIYENGTSGGLVVDQGDRDNNLYGARLRLGYELTPLITPFVEGELTRRVYDRAFDDSGLQRASRGEALRAGFAYDSAPVLKGELAVGVRQETFDDASLAALKALTVDGSLVWSPTALTTITYAVSTGINSSTDAASSGSVVYDGSVDFAYAYRSNLTADLVAGVKQERFQGTGETANTFRLGVGTVWKVNRNLQLTSGYVHEWLQSNNAARDYASDTVRVEMRVQR